MGQHIMSRPPKFVHGYIDRHGKPRFYLRRAGFKEIPRSAVVTGIHDGLRAGA